MTAQKLKVLIAEDEPAMLSLVSRHARNLGFSVVEASDGDEAWALARKHVPDLVILDVMMPGMSGWEVCKRIKAPSPEGTFASTGVIMLTGIGENLNEMTSPLFKANGWLNKPFDFQDLDAKIREVLSELGKSAPGAAGAEEAPAEEKPAAKATNGAAKPAVKKAAAKKPAAKKSAAKAPAKKGAAKAPAAKKSAAKAPAKKAAAKAPAKGAAKPAAKSAAKAPAKGAAKPAAKSAAKKPAAKAPAKGAAKKPAAKKPAAASTGAS